MRSPTGARAVLLVLALGAGCRSVPGPGGAPQPCDTNAECPGGSCVGGFCSYCDSCGPGETCVGGACLPVSCGDVPCYTDQGCWAGRCVDETCLNVACAANEVCRGGTCVPSECSCAPNQECVDGLCVLSRCVGVPCRADEACADGVCEFLSCASGQCARGAVCRGGECVLSACAGARCPSGTACVQGRCEPTSCDGAACPPGQVCQSGACRERRCEGLACDPPTRCNPDTARCDPCATYELGCTDGTDDDCDGAVDCADADCAGNVCNDAKVCTTQDRCSDGVCQGTPVRCADQNPCTDDRCEEPTGCVFPPKLDGATCGPGASDGQHCQSGACVCGSTSATTETVCDDGINNDCRRDGDTDCADNDCNGDPCDDGNPCTTGERCQAGGCTGGVAVTCGAPPNSCYLGGATCDPATGVCTFVPKALGQACDDGNPCTGPDGCSGDGRCVGAGCSPGEQCCAGVCRNTQADPLGCGAQCVNCQASGKVCCNGVCRDVLTDPLACGACNSPCPDSDCYECVSGTCQKRADGYQWGPEEAQRCCNGESINISLNPAHCGGCGLACAPGEACRSLARTNCGPSTANLTGRCTCDNDGECPPFQHCRSNTPGAHLCSPGTNGCNPGQLIGEPRDCPRFCRYP